MKVDKANKIKRQEAIIYKIAKQIPSDNDKYYVKYNRDTDTNHIEKEDKKNQSQIVAKRTKKIKKTDQKNNKYSKDEINQIKKKQKSPENVLPK